MVTNQQLHVEVVTGVIQILLFLNKERGRSISFFEMGRVGNAGKSEEAIDYIGEFIKDGVIELTQDDFTKVENGDYSQVWKGINRSLAQFGHPPVEPVPIDLKPL